MYRELGLPLSNQRAFNLARSSVSGSFIAPSDVSVFVSIVSQSVYFCKGGRPVGLFQSSVFLRQEVCAYWVALYILIPSYARRRQGCLKHPKGGGREHASDTDWPRGARIERMRRRARLHLSDLDQPWATCKGMEVAQAVAREVIGLPARRVTAATAPDAPDAPDR